MFDLGQIFGPFLGVWGAKNSRQNVCQGPFYSPYDILVHIDTTESGINNVCSNAYIPPFWGSPGTTCSRGSPADVHICI